jgi:hypothetical protein
MNKQNVIIQKEKLLPMQSLLPVNNSSVNSVFESSKLESTSNSNIQKNKPSTTSWPSVITTIPEIPNKISNSNENNNSKVNLSSGNKTKISLKDSCDYFNPNTCVEFPENEEDSCINCKGKHNIMCEKIGHQYRKRKPRHIPYKTYNHSKTTNLQQKTENDNTNIPENIQEKSVPSTG